MKVSNLPNVSSLSASDKMLVQTNAGKTSLASLSLLSSVVGGGAVFLIL